MKDLTIFTVEITDNNYLNDPICKLCLNSWKRLIDNMKVDGINVNIKIYKYDDPEVIEFKKIYKNTNKCIKENRLDLLSDAFRMYILSKHENYCWLDSDIYMYKNCYIDYKYQFRKSFEYICNVGNIDIFKKAFEIYLNESELKNDVQMDLFKKLKIDESPFIRKGINHLNKLTYKFRTYDFITNKNELNEFISRNKTIQLKTIICPDNLKIDFLNLLQKNYQLFSKIDIEKRIFTYDPTDIELINFIHFYINI